MDEFKADAADRKLQEMFASAPLPDIGFSDRVVRRLKRDARRRKLLVSMAVVMGAIFAAGPLLQLLRSFSLLIAKLDSGIAVATAPLATLQTGLAMPLIAVLSFAALAAVKLLEE